MRGPNLIRKLLWIALAAAPALPMAAAAEEFLVAFDVDGEYNSNILGSQRNEIDAFVSRIGPVVSVKDPYGRLTYEGRYKGNFIWYANARNLDSYEQYFDADVAYDLGRRTRLSASESFRDVSSIRFSVDEQDDLADTLDGGRDQFVRSVFEASIEHAFTRRFSGDLVVNHDLLDFQNDHSQTDSTSMGATGSLAYAFSSRNSFGLGGGFAYQKFEAAGNRLASQGRIWNGFLRWVHKVSDDLRFSLQGGPSFVKSIGSGKFRTERFFFGNFAPPPPGGNPGGFVGPCATPSTQIPGSFIEGSCATISGLVPNTRTNVRVVGSDPVQNNVTFFGSASLVQNWDTWQFRASYTRRQSAASGDDGTSVLDRALLSVAYDADELWSFYGSVAWSRRERLGRPTQFTGGFLVQPRPGDGRAERVGVVSSLGKKRSSTNDQYSVILGTKRRLTKRLSAEATLRYRYQIRRQAVNENRRAEFVIVGLSLQYVFDPVRF